jgi:heme/copper-type cytochrome/quinol oxidase subunit 3
MFVGVTAAALSLARSTVRPLMAAAAACAAILALLFLTGYGTALADLATGNLKQPYRSFIDQLHYGLLISEAVQVYAQMGLFPERFAEYLHYLPTISGATHLFEWPGPILTTIILISPFAILVRQFVPGPVEDIRARAIWLALTLLAFGLIFVTGQIRAPGRIIPFLSFFALVAFCLGLEMPLASGRRLAPIAAAAAALLVLGSSPAFGLLTR